LLLSRNCNVVIGDLALRPEAQELVDKYTSKPKAIFVKTNVVIWDHLTNLFDQADKEFGGADIVCTGVLPKRNPCKER
jgi:NAD(P)-dependent dehydrogenase (short-subunit alcohol dehydrogenase family)